VGNLQTVTYPNGVAHSYTYDTRNRLTNLGVSATAGTLASYAYTLDASGHRTSVTELSGRTVNYGYDNLYRLTSEMIASDPNAINGTVSYNYDPVGNRTQMTSTLAGGTALSPGWPTLAGLVFARVGRSSSSVLHSEVLR
jgi:YD repeat-containing protein